MRVKLGLSRNLVRIVERKVGQEQIQATIKPSASGTSINIVEPVTQLIQHGKIKHQLKFLGGRLNLSNLKIKPPETFISSAKLLCVVNCTQCGRETDQKGPALNTCGECKAILGMLDIFSLCPKCHAGKAPHTDKHLQQLIVVTPAAWWESPLE